MNSEAQAVCGFSTSVCATIASIYAWMPILQLAAVVVAIVSGVFTIIVSIKKLRRGK